MLEGVSLDLYVVITVTTVLGIRLMLSRLKGSAFAGAILFNSVSHRGVLRPSAVQSAASSFTGELRLHNYGPQQIKPEIQREWS